MCYYGIDERMASEDREKARQVQSPYGVRQNITSVLHPYFAGRNFIETF